VSKYHRNSRSELASYGRLSAAFGNLVINKLSFHQKYPEIPPNFMLKDSTLSRYLEPQYFKNCRQSSYIKKCHETYDGISAPVRMSASHSYVTWEEHFILFPGKIMKLITIFCQTLNVSAILWGKCFMWNVIECLSLGHFIIFSIVANF
jgi:hypothetical protein